MLERTHRTNLLRDGAGRSDTQSWPHLRAI
jgi:hypothetical protein